MIKIKLIDWLNEKIDSKEIIENTKLPKETELMTILNVSKMTVRKQIDKLIEKGFLYSVSGNGVYLSPFYKFSSLDYDNKLQFPTTKSVFLPTTNELPIEKITKYFPNESLVISDWYIFARLRFSRENRAISYSINFLNIKNAKISKKEIYKMSLNHNNFNVDSFPLIKRKYEVIKLEPSIDTDRNILEEPDLKATPTKTIYYVSKQNKLILLEIQKIKPTDFKSYHQKPYMF